MAELSLEHVSFLAHHLTPHASVWRKLGTALNFRQQDLDNIQSCLPLLSSSPYSFMQRLVEEWLEGKYPHTAPPTLANLLKALNSHTVGLGTLATLITDSLPQYDQSVGVKVVEIASVSDNGNITFKRSEAIRVNESTGVRLIVGTSSELQATFQWKNTGLVPINNIANTPTLHIAKANIDMDGSEYTCVIKHYHLNVMNYYHHASIQKSFDETTTTTPVTLRVSCPQLDQFKESLASLYLAQPEVPQDSWPPVSNKTYINLALIKQQQAIDYSGKYARLTIRGDMDDILHHKEKIEYKNIFDGLRSGSLFLIEGRPGSGKTTFVHKIARDWAASEVQGPRRLVLLVSLRVLNSWEKPVTLEDILNLLNIQLSPIVLQERNGRGVCFIFDGLDEFSPLEGKHSVVYKIINKTCLPQSIVIVASRPAALVKLRQRANKIVEVIGFLKEQIFEYIKNYHFSDPSKADELKMYFLSHPNILHICYLPIHAAMVAFLFDVMGKVPRTETEIYTHFTRFTLMRSLSKHEEQDELEDMDIDELLSGEERELFGAICEHALEITKSKKQVLDQDKKMKALLVRKDIKGISLGLVTVDRTAGLYGFKNIYTFLHLTYQEYLAAHHISTLSDEDQHKLIKQYGGIDHMQVVWKFYYGLVNFEGHEFKIEALISERENIGLYDIQCAYESQQDIVCNFFMQKMNAQIVLDDQHLTTTDFTALGYLLANSSMPVSLSLMKCDLNVESAKTLLAEIGEELLSLHTLRCESTKIDTSALILLLINNSEPVSLFLNDCHINTKEVTTLQNEAKICLHTLCYESREVDFKSLSKLLSQQSSLECLEISCTEKNSVYHDFSGIVSTSLTNLKKLCLTNIRVKLDKFSSVLQCCKKLTSLILNGVFKESDNIKPFLAEVSKCTKLEEMSCTFSDSANCVCIRTGSLPDIHQDNMLYIQGVRGNNCQTLMLISSRQSFNVYPILAASVSGFSAVEKLILKNLELSDAKHFVSDILSHCDMLKELDLSHTTSHEEIKVVLTCLKNCSNFEKLVLSQGRIKRGDVCFLASCLQHWPKLQELHLRGCGIEEDGAKAIADNIRYCPELTEVDLRENNFSNETFQMIKSSLQSHNKVTESSLLSRNEVTESSLQSHNEVTESSSCDEVTESSSHNEVTESSSHNEVTESSSHNEVTESSSHNEVTESSLQSCNEVTESTSLLQKNESQNKCCSLL